MQENYKIISRKEAESLGEKHFFTGKPCVHGHLSPRYVSDRYCVACRSIRNKKVKLNPASLAKKREWQIKNAERMRELRRRWKIKNKDIANNWHVEQRASPSYRLNRSMSFGIWKFLKSKKAGRHWETFVKFTVDELIAHLESKFDDKMNWENYGTYWHVDH